MPIYHHFHFERREPDGWSVPSDFVASRGFTGEPFRSFGEFAFAHPRTRWLDLFYGVDALFPLKPGAPSDRRGSPLLKYLEYYGDHIPEDIQLCWLPYTDLLIDCWDRDKLLVGTTVPTGFAHLFGDGRQNFPSEELSGAGFDPDQWDSDLVETYDEPIDYTFGRNRFVISNPSPPHEVAVTWFATIAEYIGGWCAEFKRLRMYGRDDDLRLLITRG